MLIDIRQKAEIIKKELLAPDIYRLSFKTGLCGEASPGQFVMVYPPDGAKLLGRPVCICDADENGFSIVFRAVGEGTREIAACRPGDSLYVEGPLGHGYPSDSDTVGGKEILLVGGGLGAPSLLFLAKRLAHDFNSGGSSKSITAILGYRNSSLKHFLADDFMAFGIKPLIATDDGSEGVKGNVIDAAEGSGITPDLVYACGPMPMLSAVKRYSAVYGAEAYISLEEHMACGVGVCLGCVVKTVREDAHSHVNNARICTEGPVFDAEEVDI